MIEGCSLGNKPFETFRRVARYYLDKDYPKKEVRKMLDIFLLKCDPSASLPKWSKTLDIALTKALKYNMINIEYIGITQSEMMKISRLQGIQTQRLAFTLLCLSKYWNTVNPASNFWVNNKDSDIMRMANINTSIRRQSEMYHYLMETGMIRFSKKVDNTNIRVCFADDNSVAMKITDFRNLGYQYLKYIGEPYFECQNCGITSKFSNTAKGGKQKYCKNCASQVAIKQRVNSVMKQREKT